VTDCYVYYRVDPAREAAARTALAALLAELDATDGIRGRVFRKVHEPLLWMEVYAGLADPDAVMDRVDALAHKHGLAACLAENQRRHVEHFMPFGEPGTVDAPANPGI
jgi:hypothetical protein